MTINFSRRNVLNSIGCLAVSTSGLVGCGPTTGKSAATAATTHRSIATRNVIDHVTDGLLAQIRRQSIPPPQATRAFAMGHLAGFLALNGVVQRYRTPHSIGNGPAGADPQTAYATAFSRAAGIAVGANMGPHASSGLAHIANSDRKSLGVTWGERVGTYVAGIRRQDGSGRTAHVLDSQRYPKRRGPMTWVPTGNHHGARGTVATLANAPPLLPGWGKLRPFGISSARAFRPEAFPAANSPEFARQFQKVKHLGRFQNSQRSADQTQIAMFWEDGPGGVSPPGHWQVIAMRVLQPLGLDLITYAHHLALFSMSQADAAIVAWDSKYHYDVVRPVTAIRTYGNHIQNNRNLNQADPTWRSLIPSPPFPAYISGHSAFAGASARMLANVIGTDSIRFSGPAADPHLWPTYLNGVQRSWSGLWQAAQECGDSREYGGVHWEHDNTQGLVAGRNIADSIFRTAFR